MSGQSQKIIMSSHCWKCSLVTCIIPASFDQHDMCYTKCWLCISYIPHENTIRYNVTCCLQDNNNVHTLCRAKNGGDPWLNSTQVLCIVSVATIHMQNQTIYIDNVLHTLRYGKCIEVLFVTLLWSLPARMFRFASFVENIKKRVFLTIPKRWFVVNPPIRVRRNFLDFEGLTASRIGATP